MLRSAISFFPAFREMGISDAKGKIVPFPDALPGYIEEFANNTGCGIGNQN